MKTQCPLPHLILVPIFLAILTAAQAGEARGKRPRLTTAQIQTEERVFKRAPQGELKVIIHYPQDWKPADRRPAMLFFFGGAWKHGSPVQFEPQANYFAARGIVCARAEYRIESKHRTTADKCIEDAKSAMRWLRSHAGELGVDPDKIIASGGSAGGHLAAATAMVPKFESGEDAVNISCKPNALVLFNPALHYPEFGVKDADGKPLADFWPTPFLTKDAPPSIHFFGSEDRMLSQGREYLAKAKELGCRADLCVAKGQSHGFFNRSPWTEITARQADLFLTTLGYLKGDPGIEMPPGAPALTCEQ